MRVTKVASSDGIPAPAATTAASAPLARGVPPTVGGEGVEETAADR